jgi:hypothetical protein
VVRGAAFLYQEPGRLHVQVSDGSEFDAGPEQLTDLPTGHDAWVAGDETAFAIDVHGATNQVKGQVFRCASLRRVASRRGRLRARRGDARR